MFGCPSTAQNPELLTPGFGECNSELPALASWGHGIQRGLQKLGGTCGGASGWLISLKT